MVGDDDLNRDLPFYHGSRLSDYLRAKRQQLSLLDGAEAGDDDDHFDNDDDDDVDGNHLKFKKRDDCGDGNGDDLGSREWVIGFDYDGDDGGDDDDDDGDDDDDDLRLESGPMVHDERP